MNNNNDIISNIIKKIDSKQNIKDNIINKFFIQNNIQSKDIFPNVSFKNKKNGIYDQYINIPINKFNNPNKYTEEKNIYEGDDYIFFNNGYSQILVSEKDVIKNNIFNNSLINVSDKDIIEFQELSANIIEYSDNYKEDLKNINGKDFETIISLISQGNNIKNILNLEHIPYEEIKNNINNKIEEKDLEQFLRTKKIYKKNCNILKHIYSTKSKHKTLYDILDLKNKNTELYFDFISNYGGYGKTIDNKYVSPKTDIYIKFFTLDKSINDLSERYKKRISYIDTLNISLKQDTFYGYQNIHIPVQSNRTNKDKILTNLRKKISSMSNNQIANNISSDFENVFYKNIGKNYNDIEDINITITNNNSTQIKDNSFIGRNFNYHFTSTRKLGSFDNSSEYKKTLIKFLYGNFTNTDANANAMLHVKNKSSLNNINELLLLIQPISFFDKELQNFVENLNLIYNIKMRSRYFLNIKYDKIKIIPNEKTKYIIYENKNNFIESIHIYKYIFKNELMINYFLYELHSRINALVSSNVSFEKVKKVLYNAVNKNSNMTIVEFIKTFVNMYEKREKNEKSNNSKKLRNDDKLS